MAQAAYLGELAETCTQVHRFTWGLNRHHFPFDGAIIPNNGLYILFEKGEVGHEGERIVRIGTHTGEGQLPSRLAQHFINPNKDRSIFRKNIGRALLAKEGDPFLKFWEIDRTTRKAKEAWKGKIDESKQAAVEDRVSRYIQESFSFVVFDLNEKADRLALEAKLIGTVNQCPVCRPSGGWLGRYSPKQRIRESGLWLIQGLAADPLSPSDMAFMKDTYRA